MESLAPRKAAVQGHQPEAVSALARDVAWRGRNRKKKGLVLSNQGPSHECLQG